MGLISRVSSRTYRSTMDRRINLQLPGPGSYNRGDPSKSQLQWRTTPGGGEFANPNANGGGGGGPPQQTQAELANNVYLMMHGGRQQTVKKVSSSKVRISKPVDTTISPCQTIYVNNLNESIRIPELKTALIAVFKQFGTVTDIVAMKSVKRRGKAYISFG